MKSADRRLSSVEIKRDLKTPCYVIDQDELDTNFAKLETALQTHWNHYRIGYSYKTNALPWAVQHFLSLGCCSEVVSEEEYQLGKLLGTAPDRFIYNGPIKTKETFLDALQNGSIVNIDSRRELDWLSELPTGGNYQVGIRVNFDIEKFCPGQSQCGDEGGRFGFCYENGDLKYALDRVAQAGIRLSGLHLHTSSKSRGLEIYDAIAHMAVELMQVFQLEPGFIDVGGGFFGGLPTKPQFDEYISRMAAILRQATTPEKTELIVEPGMCVIGAPISYVSTVIDVKDSTYSRFVITDGTRTNLDPMMSKHSYFHTLEHASQNTHPKQVICGYTCMEHDRLFVAENAPELQVGDRIIYHKVGAYTMCLTPLFIKYFPDVYVSSGGKLQKVRSAWTPHEYIQNSL